MNPWTALAHWRAKRITPARIAGLLAFLFIVAPLAILIRSR